MYSADWEFYKCSWIYFADYTGFLTAFLHCKVCSKFLIWLEKRAMVWTQKPLLQRLGLLKTIWRANYLWSRVISLMGFLCNSRGVTLATSYSKKLNDTRWSLESVSLGITKDQNWLRRNKEDIVSIFTTTHKMHQILNNKQQ